MILSRFVKIQLAVFVVLALVASWLMVFSYMQIQTQAGIGRITVTMEAPRTGGLYRFANVSYRGVDVGRVSEVKLTDDGVAATLSIEGDRKIPKNLRANIRSMSAMGELYVDLVPDTDSGPYLRDGERIAADRVDVPEPVAPMLEKLNGLVSSIPKDDLFTLVDELNKGMGGRGYDLQSLINSTSTLASGLKGNGDDTATLLRDSVPLVRSQTDSLDAIREWASGLDGVSEQLSTNVPQIRDLMSAGPGFADEVNKTLDSVKLTLPVLLSNVTSLGQLAVTYNAGLEQILVLLPASIAMIQTVQPNRNGTQWGLGTFRISGVSEPPACTVGFLDPSQWRPMEDTTTIDTPDGLYCKLPQNSPIGLRGVRNFPCQNKPGKRAPTAAMCNSDEEYKPLANSQPLFGKYPKDPNLLKQGIRPSSYGKTPATSSASPTVATATYNPSDGSYVGSDGNVYRQTELTGKSPTTWQAMMPR
ncbi:MCE family protein [Gordonia amarae]|uniref:Mce family protein n=2 Tax=Gordonia amarae TaxID=36821 RepID=G7GKE6_9ACTN|nr:MlaD family protein [Gordonia amarae]MCS3880432.1 virulence factor Mce-like protein [Gordonia amarae]QHN18766.1 MCE family protein [Gordonia amarae]QHN23241.1 MCE family protein [Gordonia amarae]QHN32143.1 MCE family protein [Gordonia amarae]QHN40889.1 MCE family protein [Gordonia amarae]